MQSSQVPVRIRRVMRSAILSSAALGVLIACATISLAAQPSDSLASGTLRIGVLKVSRHTYWFGCFFNAYDRALLDKYAEGVGQRNEQVKEVPLPLPGVSIVKVWDENAERAKEFASTFHVPHVAKNLSDMLEGVDGVLLADTNGDGSDHLRLAKPFIEKGIPIFIDKPLASTLADAREIIDLATKTGTPIMSSSVLRYVKGVETANARRQQIGDITGIVAVGAGNPVIYGVHVAELIATLAGPNPQYVQNIGDELKDVIKIHYQNGLDAIAVIIHDTKTPYTATLYGKDGSLSTGEIDRTAYQYGAYRSMQHVVEMFRTRKPPIPYSETLGVMRILFAAFASREQGGTKVFPGNLQP
jgi:predicted dehydrogenase